MGMCTAHAGFAILLHVSASNRRNFNMKPTRNDTICRHAVGVWRIFKAIEK